MVLSAIHALSVICLRPPVTVAVVLQLQLVPFLWKELSLYQLPCLPLAPVHPLTTYLYVHPPSIHPPASCPAPARHPPAATPWSPGCAATQLDHVYQGVCGAALLPATMQHTCARVGSWGCWAGLLGVAGLAGWLARLARWLGGRFAGSRETSVGYQAGCNHNACDEGIRPCTTHDSWSLLAYLLMLG